MADMNFVSYLVQAERIGTAAVPARQELAGGQVISAKMPFRLTDIVNVQDFGAVGDGVANDRAAIQAAFDFAYTDSGGVRGNGTDCTKNKIVFFPPGHYMINSALNLRQVNGSRIIGSGQNSTIIENTNTTQDGSNGIGAVEVADCINAQGYAYTTMEHLTLKAFKSIGSNGWGGACFRMRQGSSSFPCQSNNFYNVTFDGGQIGIELAAGHGSGAQDPLMCSETMIMGCVFKNQTALSTLFREFGGVGVKLGGYNACDQSVIGCVFQNCNMGIYEPSGSVNIIQNCMFNNGDQGDISSITGDLNASGGGSDILAVAGANDSHIVRGCRSSSRNFIASTKGSWVVEGCIQTSALDGFFVAQHGGVNMVIRGCTSTNGRYEHATDNNAYLSNCKFGRSDWLSWNSANVGGHARIEIEDLLVGSTPTQLVRQRISNSSGMLTENYVVA